MKNPVSTCSFRAAAPGRPKQGPTMGHAVALSWPEEGRSPYSVFGAWS